jgi:hypothetical protein
MSKETSLMFDDSDVVDDIWGQVVLLRPMDLYLIQPMTQQDTRPAPRASLI